MHCRVFCNLADSSSASKQIRKLWCSRPKKKKTTHVTIQVQAFRRKPRKLRLFSRNKKPWGLNKGKRKSNGKLQLWSNPVRKHLPKHKPQETNYSICKEQTSFVTSKCETQSGKRNLLIRSVEYSMHCINYAKREQEKPLLFKLTLRSRLTLSRAQSLLSRAFSCVWLFNT